MDVWRGACKEIGPNGLEANKKNVQIAEEPNEVKEESGCSKSPSNPIVM